MYLCKLEKHTTINALHLAYRMFSLFKTCSLTVYSQKKFLMLYVKGISRHFNAVYCNSRGAMVRKERSNEQSDHTLYSSKTVVCASMEGTWQV